LLNWWIYIAIFALNLGIGKATALRFAKEGCQVIATDINKEALKRLDGISGTKSNDHFYICAGHSGPIKSLL
jgi:NAD(P)-dependent dehydrogenase (short-subunit alcohol dehydrogenase family)